VWVVNYITYTESRKKIPKFAKLAHTYFIVRNNLTVTDKHD